MSLELYKFAEKHNCNFSNIDNKTELTCGGILLADDKFSFGGMKFPISNNAMFLHNYVLKDSQAQNLNDKYVRNNSCITDLQSVFCDNGMSYHKLTYDDNNFFNSNFNELLQTVAPDTNCIIADSNNMHCFPKNTNEMPNL